MREEKRGVDGVEEKVEGQKLWMREGGRCKEKNNGVGGSKKEWWWTEVV